MKANTLMALAATFILMMASSAAAFGQDSSLNDLFKNIPQSGSEGNTSKADTGTSAGASSGGSAPASNTWSLSGEQVSTYHLPILRDPLDYSGLYLKPSVKNTVDIGASVAGVKVVSNWEVDLWPLGVPTGTATLSAGPADITVSPLDNYVEVNAGTLSFRGGYFVDQWGAADGLNPTNNVNPVDYTQGLSPVSIPSLLFRIIYYPLPSLSIEGVFEPYKRGDLFPIDPTASIPSSLFTASEVTVTQPSVGLASSVFGAKISLYTPAVDLSVSYLYDIDPFYTPRITYVSYADKSLDLVRTRIHRIGADAKTTLGGFGIWLEACLSITEDPQMTSFSVRNPSLSWTAGTDVNYGPDQAFYLNFQYTGRYVFKYDRSFYTDYPGGVPDSLLMATDPVYAREYYARALSQSLGDQTEGLLSGFILESDFPLAGGKWKPGITAAYYLPLLYDDTLATRYGSLVLQPRIDFAPSDSTTLTLGSELMYAWKKDAGSNSVVVDTTDRIGMWNDQSNVYLMLDVKW